MDTSGESIDGKYVVYVRDADTMAELKRLNVKNVRLVSAVNLPIRTVEEIPRATSYEVKKSRSGKGRGRGSADWNKRNRGY